MQSIVFEKKIVGVTSIYCIPTFRRQLRPQLELGRRGAGAEDAAEAEAAAQQDLLLRRTDRAIGKR